MTFSSHPLARLRRLQAMGVLAWLMLVFNASAAVPTSMMGMPHAGSAHATVAVVGEQHCHEHLQLANKTARSSCGDSSGPCGDAISHHCACATMCVAAIPPATFGGVVAAATSARYAAPSRIDIPTLAIAPPLRPPAV